MCRSATRSAGARAIHRCCATASPKSPMEKNRMGVLEKEQNMIDLQIGLYEYEIDKAPEVIRDLIPQLNISVAG